MNELFKKFVKKFLGTSTNSFSWGWSIPSSWDRKQFMAEYRRVVYASISSIAEETGKIQYTIKNDKGELVPDHPALKVLNNPNPGSSKFQYVELHTTYMGTNGEAFWYLVPRALSRQPTELILLRPDLVEVVIDEDGMVTGYVFSRPDGNKLKLDTDEVLHIKKPNPLNPYRGMGPVEAGMVYIQTEKFGAEWTRNAIFNNGRPSGVLGFKGTIDDKEFNQIKKRFADEYTGVDNAGKTMLLQNIDEISYQKLSMGLDEVALKDLKNISRDDIMMMFRVSKTMLGITEDVNVATANAARRVFITNVIKPEMERVVDALNTFVITRWGEGFKLEFIDPTPKDEKEQLEEDKAGVDKWVTKNEIRARRGLDPLIGGDELWQPLNLVPGPSSTSSKATKRMKVKKAKYKKRELTRNQKGEIFRERLFINQEAWVEKFKEFIAEVFKQQEKEILQRTSKVFEEWKFDPVKYKGIFIAKMLPVFADIMTVQGNVALEFAGADDMTFEVDDLVRSYITDRVAKFSDSTNQGLLDNITKTISDGVQAGESTSKLRKRIKAVYADAIDGPIDPKTNKRLESRAELIARTETIAASNQAALESYRQTGVVVGKEWFAEPDACEFCRQLDGTVIPLGTDFVEVGDSVTGVDGGILDVNYSDVAGPPAHPNCRCTVLPVTTTISTMKKELELKMKEYDAIHDKRTKEAKKLSVEMNKVKKEIKKSQKKLAKDQKKLDKDVDDFGKILDES